MLLCFHLQNLFLLPLSTFRAFDNLDHTPPPSHLIVCKSVIRINASAQLYKFLDWTSKSLVWGSELWTDFFFFFLSFVCMPHLSRRPKTQTITLHPKETSVDRRESLYQFTFSQKMATWRINNNVRQRRRLAAAAQRLAVQQWRHHPFTHF